MEKLWTANMDYVRKVQEFFDHTDDVAGEILVYGHLNPYGVDPHNRLTLACDSSQSYERAVTEVNRLRDDFLIEITRLCQSTKSLLIGGEKGAASEREIYEALGGPESCPQHLQNKFQQQAAMIAQSAPCFSWRALPPFNSVQ